MTDIRLAVTRLAREESGRIRALLAVRLNDLNLADESVQDALVEALNWKVIPDNPAAWLYTVARNRAIDHLRRSAAADRRLRASASDLHRRGEENALGTQEPTMIDDRAGVGDEHLRLLLLCCHPALDQDTQIALTLRLAGGLTTAEIAAAFLLPEPTLAQRIVRAKRKIRDARMPLSIPERLDERLAALLRVLYLIFNEAYLSRTANPVAVRVDLAEEAIRMTRQLSELTPTTAEVHGLLALELLTHARSATRLDAAGELVLLEQQDRTRWDGNLVADGNAHLSHALTYREPGPFQIQAVIAAYHANARTASATDWTAIASAYAQLAAMDSSPIVALNYAAAIGMADGAPAGLKMIDRIKGIDSYYLLHATRAELLMRAGNPTDAADAFARALIHAANPTERRHLERRAAAARLECRHEISTDSLPEHE